MMLLQRYHTMFSDLAQFLCDHPLENTDPQSIQLWKESCLYSWDLLEPLIDTDPVVRDQCSFTLDIFLDSVYDASVKVSEHLRNQKKENTDVEVRRQKLNHLLSRPQIVQRSEEWYADATQALSASQFGTIFKSPRTRGQLVLEKAGITPRENTGQRHTCITEYMNPFDWGIRFEPVVRQVYCALTHTLVGELGRLRHPTDNRLSASPDGVVIEDTEGSTQCRLGRLVEYKAPVSRKIIQKVPEDYVSQMRIQMEVAEADACDYFEVTFRSKYGAKVMPFPENPEYYGNVFLIADKDTDVTLRYEYSPLCDYDWRPTLLPNEAILETVPWALETYFLTTLERSHTWFSAVQPQIEAFWADVEKARRGEFVLPEAKPRKQVEGKESKKKPSAIQSFDFVNDDSSVEKSSIKDGGDI